MSQALARKSIWAAAIAVVAGILIVFIGLPFIASTQLVRDRIAQQLSVWSGYQVTIDEAPEIHVWPGFGAVLRDVRFQEWGEDGVPVLEAEDIEVDLSALAALRGDVVFTRVRLLRPVLRLVGSPYETPSPHRWGRLARSVQAAQTALAASPDEPDLSALPSDALGEIEFVDGRILLPVGGQWLDLVTSLTGELDWPALNRSASLTAQGIWQGETVSVRASTPQPLLLVAGGTAPLNVALEASPGTASFQGSASFSGDGLLEGDLSMAAPSLNRLAEWALGLRLPAGRIGQFSLAAQVSGNARRFKLDASSLGIDASSGRGIMELGFEHSRPSLIGTLAFDSLNLRALAQVLSPLEPPTSRGADTALLGNLDFDLRFSAATATYGSVALSKVAVAARSTDQLSTFDITDASGFGGTLQASLRTNRTAEQQALELRLNGEQVALGALADTFGRRHLIPQGSANFSVYLKGTGTTLRSLVWTSQGDISASFDSGMFYGIDLGSLLSDTAPGFTALNAETEGALLIDSAEIKATVKNGVADIRTGDIRAGPLTVSLQGLVPLAGRALALSATVTDGTNEAVRFFVGGSWDAPFVTAPIRLSRDDLVP